MLVHTAIRRAPHAHLARLSSPRHCAVQAAADAVDQETLDTTTHDSAKHHSLAPIIDDKPVTVTHIEDELKQEQIEEESQEVSTSERQPESLDEQIRALFFPAMVTFSLDPLLGAVDTGMHYRYNTKEQGHMLFTAIVGRLGPIALGSVGISNMCMNLTMMLFRFLTVVTTPAVAAAIAKNDIRKVLTGVLTP